MQRNTKHTMGLYASKNPLELVLTDNLEKIFSFFSQENSYLLFKNYNGTEPNGREWQSISPVEFAAWSQHENLLNFFHQILDESGLSLFKKQIEEINKNGTEHDKPLTPLKQCIKLHDELANEIINFVNTERLRFRTNKESHSEYATFTEFFKQTLITKFNERLNPGIELAYDLCINLPLNQFKMLHDHPYDVKPTLNQQVSELATKVCIYSTEEKMLCHYIDSFNPYKKLLAGTSNNSCTYAPENT